MNHKAHVGLVYSHTESNSGNDYVEALHQKVVLCCRACRRVETGMICRSLDIVGTQHCGQFFDLLARQTINDAALAGVLPYELNYLLVYILRLMPYLIIKVRTVERTLELCCVEYSEAFLYIRSNLVGGP